MTDKAIIKTSRIISSLNRIGSIDMSKVKKIIQNVSSLTHILRKRLCIFSKRNALYNHYITMMYLSTFFICYTRPINFFVIWTPWTLNSIMSEKYENKKELPRQTVMKKGFWEESTFLKNLSWNVDDKQSKINEVVVKVILFWKIHNKI